MTYTLPGMPLHLKNAGWAIKIRSRELPTEPPHVTVTFRSQAYRWRLRECEWMDNEPDPRDVPETVVDLLHKQVDLLREKWNWLHGQHNPV
jgi:hypothetical protein